MKIGSNKWHCNNRRHVWGMILIIHLGIVPLLWRAPYKHTTCIPRWNDIETTVSTSFQLGIHVVFVAIPCNITQILHGLPLNTKTCSPEASNIQRHEANSEQNSILGVLPRYLYVCILCKIDFGFTWRVDLVKWTEKRVVLLGRIYCETLSRL